MATKKKPAKAAPSASKKPAAKKAAPKPVAKKAAAKKPEAKKPGAKKPAAKKAEPKKPAAKKPVAKKTAPKPVAKKAAAPKPAAKKAMEKKPATKKPTVNKVAAKVASTKKAAPKKPEAKKPAAVKSSAANKPVARAAVAARRQVAEKRPAKAPIVVKKPEPLPTLLNGSVKKPYVPAVVPVKNVDTQRKPSPGMKLSTKPTAAQLKAIRKNLVDELNRINSITNTLRSESLVRNDEVNHDEDGTDAFLRSSGLARANHEQATARQIQSAIKSIDDGNYGVCEICGKRIEARRLDAIPYVRTCISCENSK